MDAPLHFDLKGCAIITTTSNTADITQTKPLKTEIILADGARKEFEKRGIKGLVPPPRNARYREIQGL